MKNLMVLSQVRITALPSFQSYSLGRLSRRRRSGVASGYGMASASAMKHTITSRTTRCQPHTVLTSLSVTLHHAPTTLPPSEPWFCPRRGVLSTQTVTNEFIPSPTDRQAHRPLPVMLLFPASSCCSLCVDLELERPRVLLHRGLR